MFKYLKDHIYYSELYDRVTIEECKRWEALVIDYSPEKIQKMHNEKVNPEGVKQYVRNVSLYFRKGERFKNKSETIRCLMEADRAKDEKLEKAREPKGIRCLKCSSSNMICLSRDFMSDETGTEEVLFMFECKHCGKRRAYWENGKEWEHVSRCPKCKAELHRESTRTENAITINYTCSQCDYTETDTMDLSKKEEEKIDPNFESDRKKYCLSEKEGAEYIEWTANLKALTDHWKEKEENKDLYDAVAKVQKLTIVDLQKLLNPVIEKAGYTKLEFDKPDLQKDVIVGFSVQDAKSGREEYDSRQNLKKLLKEALQPTNWRLMSDGVQYRLGFLQGRLKGVEGEENLRKLLERDNKLSNKVK